MTKRRSKIYFAIQCFRKSLYSEIYNKLFHDTFIDEMLYGRSLVHVDDKGNMVRLDPRLDIDEKDWKYEVTLLHENQCTGIPGYIDPNKNSYTAPVELLTIEQIKEKYGEQEIEI